MTRPIRRREFLARSSAALAGGSLYAALAQAAELGGGHPLAPRASHYAPQATNLVLIFLTGGFSHVDTFDPKPKLAADGGKPVSAESLRDVSTQPLLGSPFEFHRAGQSGPADEQQERRVDEDVDAANAADFQGPGHGVLSLQIR